MRTRNSFRVLLYCFQKWICSLIISYTCDTSDHIHLFTIPYLPPIPTGSQLLPPSPPFIFVSFCFSQGCALGHGHEAVHWSMGNWPVATPLKTVTSSLREARLPLAPLVRVGPRALKNQGKSYKSKIQAQQFPCILIIVSTRHRLLYKKLASNVLHG